MMNHPNSRQKFNLEFKLLVVGEKNVGKTSLIIRFIKNHFNDSSNPKILRGNFITTQLSLFGAPIRLKLQDLKREIWEEIASYYVNNNDGILLVFDTSSKTKIKPYLDYWFKTIRQLNSEIPILVVGNKSDLPIKVQINKISQYITKLGYNFIQTSARTGENVSYAFKLLTSEIVKKKAATKKSIEGKWVNGLDSIFRRYK